MSPIAEPCPPSNSTDVLGYALGLASLPFFLRIDKTPACPHGFYAACQGDAAQGPHRRYPRTADRLRTGYASKSPCSTSTLTRAAIDRWNENRDRLPLTRMHETRSGGIHCIFQHIEGLRCSTSKLPSHRCAGRMPAISPGGR